MSVQLTTAGEYGRSVRVTVGPKAGGQARTWTSDTYQPPAPGIAPVLVSGLRIAFEAKRDNASQPSQGSVKLYNLSVSSRSWLQSDSLQLSLEAGYGDTLRSIFVADVADVFHDKQGTDWVTTIEAGDGERAYRGATISFSGAPGISRRRVFEELARALGAVLGEIPSLPDTAYRTGVTLTGPVAGHLDALCAELGLRWSLQSGVLRVIPRGGSTSRSAVLVSSESGLIGHPALRRTDDGKAGVKFTVRLNGLLVPGNPVVVDDEQARGTFVIEKVHHSGDSGYAPPYTSTVEATELAS